MKGRTGAKASAWVPTSVVLGAVLAGWVHTASAQSVTGTAVAAPDGVLGADGRMAVLVEFNAPPAAVLYAREIERGRSSSEATSAARVQIQSSKAMQQAFVAQLPGRGVTFNELYRVQRVLNGVALRVSPTAVATLRSIGSVRKVSVLAPEFPTNSTSVPFLGTPQVWENTLGLSSGATGTGIKIGIIDTGIDYQHAHFGGTGALTQYQANDRTIITDGLFPTARVVGGMDFAGDAFTGSNVPAPDPDPMDCNGHGSHVAGTAGGGGVNADGSAFTGPYNTATPFAGLRIGPGVAPQASLYALRVFGCGGATNLTVAAIEWATDPNDDGDFSDRLDVINMSLGSAFGTVTNSSAVASDNAALVGVSVVASAGNSGDISFVSGSPGSGTRVIATASAADSGIVGTVLNVNAPAGIAAPYPAQPANFTDPTAPPPPAPNGQTGNVVLAVDATGAPNDGCDAPTNAAAIAGNLMLAERGTCGFVVKAQVAAAAGATGLVVMNNVAGDPALITMSGASTVELNFPSVFVSQATGNTLRSVSGVNATLQLTSSADVVSSFSSRGPRRISSPAIRLKPDLAAPGFQITSALTGVTCTVAGQGCGVPNASGFNPDNQPRTISGTSMAAPHAAGMVALLRQLHPDWSTEEIKAAAMNGALRNVSLGANGSGGRIPPSRAGTGRIDPPVTAQELTLVLNDDDHGLVSVSFDREIVGTVSQQKTVRVINRGSSAVTYTLAIDTVVDAPGVAFSLPGGNTVTVPAGQTRTLVVQMDANAAQMDHVLQPTMTPVQAFTAPLAALGTAARHYLTEEASLLTFTSGAQVRRRLALYVPARPASTMAAAATIVTGGAPTGSTTIPLSGTDVCTGTLGAGPTCTGSFPTDNLSLVSPFELHAVSPRNTAIADFLDLQYGGVAWDAGAGQLRFGIATYGPWSSATDISVNIRVDFNEDGTYDRILFNGNNGSLASLLGTNTDPSDTFVSAILNTGTSGVSVANPPLQVNRVAPNVQHTRVLDNNVMFLSATPAQLGLPVGDTTFRYQIVTCSGTQLVCSQTGFGTPQDTAAGPFFYNSAAQGLDFGGATLLPDLNGSSIPVTWNIANMATNGALGALLLHHFNREGSRAEVVVLEGTPQTDLAVTQAVDNPAPALGSNVVITTTVNNASATTATSVVVADLLPAGLTYVADNSGGAYSSSTGLWNVGALANGATATLAITATVQTSDQIDVLAQLQAPAPIDTQPANDSASVSINAADTADLAVTAVASAPTVLVGGAFSITYTVTNAGADQGYSLALAENFPLQPTLDPGTFTASSGTYNPTTGLWNIASLTRGASATLVLNFTAPSMAGVLTNNGALTASTADNNTANNTASAAITVLSPAALTATKTAAGQFRPGGAISYSVVISNSATTAQFDNPGNEFTDVLPAGLTLVSASATSGTAVATVATNTVTWNGSVPGSGAVTITINATVAAAVAPGSLISNQGNLSFDADGNGANEATGLTDDPAIAGAGNPTVFTVLSPAALAATKVASGSTAPGGAVVYTIVVNNTAANAQADNPGNEFTDTLPVGLTLVSASASSGTAVATIGTGTVTWNGSIAAGGSVTITINATINATVAAGSTLSNQGTVNFDADGNGSNESTAQTDDPAVAGVANPTLIVVLAPSSVSGTKTLQSAAQVFPGASVSYRIVLSNAGPAAQTDLAGDEFVDVLPAAVGLLNATASSGTITSSPATNTVRWNGAIAAGASVTIQINGRALPTPSQVTANNQGTIQFDGNGDGINEATALTDDPSVAGAANPTALVVLASVQIPVGSPTALLLMLLLVAVGGIVGVRSRR